MKRRKNNISILLIVCLALVGIGYAYIQSSLSINGTATVDSASWDIHFENVNVKEGSVAATEAPANPSAGEKVTSLTYSVNLSKPGDFYEFTVDVVNSGNIDGMIDTISSKYNGVVIGENTLPTYLRYSATYSDGVKLEKNHLLKQGTSEELKVRIEFRDDITANDLPSTAQSIELGFELTYRQANKDGVERKTALPNPAYVVSTTNMFIGQNIPSGVNLRSKAAEAISDWGSILGEGHTHSIYLKHKLNEEEKIEESYVEFIYNDQTYALRGGDSGVSYESNKEVLLSAFGSDNCTDNSSAFSCDADGLNAFANSKGGVYAIDDDLHGGYVYDDGNSFCSDGLG